MKRRNNKRFRFTHENKEVCGTVDVRRGIIVFRQLRSRRTFEVSLADTYLVAIGQMLFRFS